MVFIINGNQGSYEQFPIIGNSLEYYLDHLVLNQLEAGLPSWISRPENTNFNVKVFGYDLEQTPHAFSEQMFMDQAEFISAAI